MNARGRARRLWPTREGWCCLGGATLVGIAAVSSGNNLLYLLVSLLLALIVVSGVFSERSLHGLRLTLTAPADVHAGQPTVLALTVFNSKRWMASHSLRVATLPAVGAAALVIPLLRAGGERVVTWEVTLPRRGRHRLPAVRATTRFPFGLFEKAAPPVPGAEVIVFPALVLLSLEARRALDGDGEQTARRLGQGHELYALREYVPGDDPRLVHWRSSAKAGTLVVRDLEAPTQLDTRIVLVGSGVRDAERRERGLSETASLAVELLAAGAAVELTGPGVLVPVGTGAAQTRRILTTLALFDPEVAVNAPGGLCHSGARLREVRVRLG